MRFSSRSQVFAVAALYGGCVLPFIAGAAYCQPFVDDYSIAQEINSGGFGHYFVRTYLHWSGRYAASLMGACHPFRWTNSLAVYRLWVGLLVLGLAAAVPLAVGALLHRAVVPRAWKWQAALGAGCLFFLNMPSPAEGFYWLISALAYTVPLGVASLLLWLEASRTAGYPKAWQIVRGSLSIMLALLLPGFSEMTAVAVLVVAGIVALRHWQQPARAPGWWWLPAAGTIGSLLLLGAPGNYTRAVVYTDAARLGLEAGRAAAATGYMLLNWLGNVPLLLGTLLYLPLGQRLAQQPSPALLSRWARWPWAGPLTLVLVLAGCNLLVFLAIHQPLPARCRNVLYLLLLLSWLVTLQSFLQSRWAAVRLPLAGPLRAVAIAMLVVLGISDQNPSLRHEFINRHFSTVGLAYQEWLGGDWRAYDQQQQQRLVLLRGSRPRVAFPPLLVAPRTLVYYDLADNPDHWGNQAVARAFGKQAVWVSEVVPGPPPVAE